MLWGVLEMGSSTTLFLQVQVHQLSEFCKYYVKYHFGFSSTSFEYHSSTTCKIMISEVIQLKTSIFLGESVELNFTIIFLANGKQLLYKLWNDIQSSSKLHFKNTKDARVLADILDLLGQRTFPPTEKTLSTGEPDATTQSTFLINSTIQGRSRSYEKI